MPLSLMMSTMALPCASRWNSVSQWRITPPMCSLKPGVEKHIDRYSALFSATSWITACHSTTTVLALIPLNMATAKSMLKIAQILRSPATISSSATCLQSVSLCFHPIHSRPGKKNSYKSHPILIWVNRVIMGYLCYFSWRWINGPVSGILAASA